MSSKKDKAAQRAERAAALLAEQRRRERSRNIKTAIGVVGALVLVGALAFGFSKWRGGDDVQASDIGSSDYGLVVGKTGAPHEVVIYEDFLCPICEILESTAGEQLSQLADDGKVVIDYRPISILGRAGPYSGEALNAFFVVQDKAGDEAAKKFHDLLYADQPSEQGPFPDTDWLVKKAVEAGATEADVRPGIEDDAMKEEVQAATDEAGKAGVQGTPTILLDGKSFSDGKSWQEIANNLVKAVE